MRFSSVNHIIGALFLAASPAFAKVNSISNLPEIISDIVGPDGTAPAGSCLGAYDFALEFEGNCIYDDIREKIQSYLDSGEGPSCDHDADTELMALLSADSVDAAHDVVSSICSTAWDEHEAENGYPWNDVSGYGPAWDKEYYDGNTHWNEQHQTDYNTTIEGEPANVLRKDAYHVNGLYNDEAQRDPIEFPSHIDNFDSCELRSVMCCWPSDRQANDNNGNCAEPYDENCVDADPADNTDLCAVDMSRSVSKSTKIPDGMAIFSGDTEGPIHCHGFAWGTDDMEAESRYKGNNLFYVSMYDHMYQRGYVRNVPGAPMCGCVERMPIVSRSDCTEINAEEIWRIEWDAQTSTMTPSLKNIDIDYNACRGAGGNNDLYKYYKRLRNEGRASQEEYEQFKKTVVGHGQCPNAIENLYFDKGYEVDTTGPEGWTQVYGHGAFGVEDSYPELWRLGSPYVKQDGSTDSPVFYIMRKCADCIPSHRTIIYKRLTPLPSDLNVESLFLWYWRDAPGNERGVDFDLFSSMEDALAGDDPWQFCNFNHYHVGFPRDCGPERRAHAQWNSIWHGRSDVAFYVWDENVNIGNTVSSSPTSSPTEPLDSATFTTQHYWYQPVAAFEGSTDTGFVTFTVAAIHSAHIALGEDMDHNGPKYEIVLGGWSNTRSRLRGGNQNPTLDEYIGRVVQKDVDTTFRISWTVSEIVVEQQGGSKWFEIMRFSDRDTSEYNHQIKYMMIATGWGATGTWRVTGLSAGARPMLYTKNHYSYLPVAELSEESQAAGSVLFSVAANNDAHIALGQDTEHWGEHYEVVLGGWGNNHSRIRGRNQNPTLAWHDGQVLSGYDTYVMFRISWDENMIKVERSPDGNVDTLEEMMIWTERAGSEYNWTIKYIMISTGWGSSGDWKILDY